MTTKKARDLKASGTRVRAPGKDLAELATVSHDIAERERAEEELRKYREHLEALVEQRTRELRETEEKAERKYTTILQTALDGFWVNDLKGRILDANDSYCQMIGYSREELLTMNVADIKAYGSPDDVALHINKVMRLGYDRCETRHRRKDGTPIEVEVSVNHTDIGGDRIIEFVRDITERKKAQEELEENRRRLDIAIEASQIGIWELDLISDTSIRNLKHDQIFGYEELLAEWGGKIFFEHIVPEDRPSVKAAFDEAMKTGRLFFECRIIWPDKSIHWITATGKALGDSTGEPIKMLGTVTDISERKLMQEKLLASERLAALGQLSGNISHELRTPLSVIASSVYYLQSALKGNDRKVEEHLERIKNNVDSAVAIIDSLLNLTRLKPPQLERLDLTAIICDAIASAKVPPTLSLVRDFPEQGLLVDADRVQLSMCFKNIVKNAVEAMEGTGTLTVTVHRTADGQAEISFADTGPGIPTDNLTNMFQPLFSTKAKGIGFGLSIAKMIVERHGGIIEAKSELGKGATIVIRFPVDRGEGK